MDRHNRLATILGAEFLSSSGSRVALADRSGTLTYDELWAAVSKLSQFLTVYDGRAISIEAGRSIAQVVGLLGVLMSGNVPVPLDPATPDEVREDKRKTADVVAVIDSNLTLKPRDHTGTTVFQVETLPACVLFTSGSTGKPKGVLLGAAAIGHYVEKTATLYGATEGDVFLQYSSPEFDGYLDEVFVALSVGARLHIRDPLFPAGGSGFFDACGAADVTVLELPTASWRELARSLPADTGVRLPRLRLVVIGGEAADARSRDLWFDAFGDDKIRQLNAYGPTEAAISVTFQDMRRNLPIALGAPLGAAALKIVGDDGSELPSGVSGEIWIGGVPLADGYTDEANTRAKFVFTPDGRRWYKTGDRATRDRDGQIHYEGRLDRQVKLRGGYRVELGEIEAAVKRLLPTAWAEVVAPKTRFGRLPVVFLTGVSKEEIIALRQDLATSLVSYAQPAAIEAVETFPLTSRDKVDLSELEQMGARLLENHSVSARPNATTYDMVVTALSPFARGMAIDGTTEFLGLGMDSLDAVQFVTVLSENLGKDVSFDALLRHATVIDLVRHVEADDARINLVHYAQGERKLVKLRASGETLWCFFPPLSGAATRYIRMPVLLPQDMAVWAMETPAQIVGGGLHDGARTLAKELVSKGALDFERLILSGYSLGGAFAFQTMRVLLEEFGADASKCRLALLDPVPPKAPGVALPEVARIFISVGFRCQGDHTLYINKDGLPDFTKVTRGAKDAGLLSETASEIIIRDAWKVYVCNSCLSEQFEPCPMAVPVNLLLTTGAEQDAATVLRASESPKMWRGVATDDEVHLIDTHHFALMERANEGLVQRWLHAVAKSRGRARVVL